MISNSSLREMGNLLRSAESIVIFPHESPDGDALGSCAALCRALRNEGKDAWVLLDEEIRGYLEFMDTEYCTTDIDCVSMPDICICVDCSEENRFSGRAEKFREGKTKLCIDPVSYTHLDVYKRQASDSLLEFICKIMTCRTSSGIKLQICRFVKHMLHHQVRNHLKQFEEISIPVGA